MLSAITTYGCTKRPDSPARNNPFDPGNPSGSDPFELVANPEGTTVRLDWNDVPIEAAAGYSVYRGRDEESISSGKLKAIASALRTSAFRDTLPLHDAVSYYAVTVVNARGEESLRSATVPVALDLPAFLDVVNENGESVSRVFSRQVRLRLLSDRTEEFVVSNDSAFAAAETLMTLEGYVAWTLSAGAGASDTVRVVYVRPRSDDEPRVVVTDTVRAAAPRFQMLANDRASGTVASGRRELTIHFREAQLAPGPPPGSATSEIELSWELPFPGQWQDFPDVASGSSLPWEMVKPDLDTLYVRMRNDFGLIGLDSIEVKADSLQAAKIVLNNSRTTAESARTRLNRVNVHVSGGVATSICLSNVPIPPCSNFEQLDGPRLDWPLAGAAGAGVRVYAILANEWRPEGAGVVSDSIYIEGDSLLLRLSSFSRVSEESASAGAAIDTTAFSRTASTSIDIGDSILIRGIARRTTFGSPIANVRLFIDDLGAAASTIEVPGVVTRSASPGDTFDLSWVSGWRVSGEEEGTLRLRGVATDLAEPAGQASDSVKVSLALPDTAETTR